MNFISQYQHVYVSRMIKQSCQPSLDSFKKIIMTILQRFRQQSVTFISPPIGNIGNFSIDGIPDILAFIILHDSKLPNYSYSFQIQANFVLSKLKIVATILKNGVMMNINKQSHSQILCSYALSINSLTSNYSFRVHPYTGTIKYVYVTQCADKVINDMFVFPVQNCERIKKQIEEMVNRLDQRLLGKILHVTNQIPINHILSSSVDSLFQKTTTQQTIEEINKIQSIHPLFPQGTLHHIYTVAKNYRDIRKHLCNCSIKYPFFNLDQQSTKIKFFPQMNPKKRQPQKQQKIIRHNIKLMPFTKEIKNILKLYTSVNQLFYQENLYGKGQTLWIQPTQSQIKQIYNTLAVKNFILGGRILNTISIHSIQSQVTIGIGGFAQIRRAIVYFCKRQVQNPESKLNMIQQSQIQKFRHPFVRKVAARQKLTWEKSVIKHIGRGQCLFIHKYFDAKVDPLAVGLQKHEFDDCLFMQYCQQRSLNNYLSKMNSIISTKTKVFLIYQVSVGLRFLRDYGVVHLDIKPENILIKMASTASSSFALAKIIDFGQAYCQILLHKKMHRGHTCPYAPPQLVRQSDKYSQKSDAFSLGVMILIMIFDLNTVDIKRLTSNTIFQSNDGYIKYYSICLQRCKYFGYEPLMQCLLNLAYKCISPNTSVRPYLNWICVILRDLLNTFEQLER